jgi:CheY-like chemotaxis protein
MIPVRGKLFLIHWNAAQAETLANGPIFSDWEIEFEAEDGRRAYEAIKANPPAAIIIYLTRLPSHGRETADALRTYKATREIPIVFVGGQGEALVKTKAKVPSGIFATESELAAVLRQFSDQ